MNTKVPEPILEARGIYKVFGKQPQEAVKKLRSGATREEVKHLGNAAVIDVSFTVNPGEIFVIMGLSGSGKSTLIRTLNGLLQPTSGDVVIQGSSVTQATPSRLREIRRESVSMVFQHFALLPHKSVIENAAYALEIQGVPLYERQEKAQQVLEKVGLGDWVNHYPDELSGGMRQRVGLARALTAETPLLLMDEAFSALDPLIRREVQEQLIELQQELGRTIIFITHDLNEAMFLGNRIAVMKDGQIMQIGTPEEILNDPANDYVEQFVQDVDRARVISARSVMEPNYAVSPLSAGLRGAARVLRERQVGSIFIVKNRQLLGAVSDVDIIKALKSGKTSLESIIETEVPQVNPEDCLADVVERSVESNLPVAVIDENKRLLGIIPRLTLLAALAHSNGDTTEIPEVGPAPAVEAAEITQALKENGAV